MWSIMLLVLKYGALALGLLILISSCFFTVEQKTAKIVLKFRKFNRVAQAGLNLKWPLIESVASGSINLRIQELPLPVETKTKDNVFVKFNVAVEHCILPNKVFDAFYMLQEPMKQIESYVFHVVRALVPEMTLDELFDKKDDIADEVSRSLSGTMADFGYNIVNTLVTDIDPDPTVKESMNAINAAERHKAAAEAQGDADKTIKVKAAEAQAQSMERMAEAKRRELQLQGQGIAERFSQISESVKASMPGASEEQVIEAATRIMYIHAMTAIGADSKSNTVFTPTSLGAPQDLLAQISGAMIAAGRVNQGLNESAPAPATTHTPTN